MSLRRRQFLILGGIALGLGPGVLAHRSLRQQSAGEGAIAPPPTTNTSTNTPTNTPVASAQPTPTYPAPAGLYAPERGDVRLVVISDLNSRYGATTYRAEVEAGVKMIPDWQPDLVICSGDMVAGQSLNLNLQQVQAMWTSFDQRVFTPIRQTGLPFALTLGNHDASSVFSRGEFVYALDRTVADAFWNQPQRDLGLQFVDRAGFPFYYSFEQNQIFYLVWDASSATVADEQIAWAERSLASDTAQTAKMRIAIGHLPFYAVSQGRDRAGEILNRADELRSLLERYRVHTYISGHHHAYFPGHVGQLEMLYTGALGSGPRSLLGTTTAPFQTLTVIDINLDAATTNYTTYNMATLKVVDESTLPRLLVGPNGRVLRHDITLADLTPEEKNRQHFVSK
ncbi:MAG: metallophosphoesterase [Cyanothece sp. SIO1E1]|nr:metallophosphoesterase [Cyanothece sp. SIO1E1]